MAVRRTEQRTARAGGLDLQPPEVVLRFLAEPRSRPQVRFEAPSTPSQHAAEHRSRYTS